MAETATARGRPAPRTCRSADRGASHQDAPALVLEGPAGADGEPAGHPGTAEDPAVVVDRHRLDRRSADVDPGHQGAAPGTPGAIGRPSCRPGASRRRGRWRCARLGPAGMRGQYCTRARYRGCAQQRSPGLRDGAHEGRRLRQVEGLGRRRLRTLDRPATAQDLRRARPGSAPRGAERRHRRRRGRLRERPRLRPAPPGGRRHPGRPQQHRRRSGHEGGHTRTARSGPQRRRRGRAGHRGAPGRCQAPPAGRPGRS